MSPRPDRREFLRTLGLAAAGGWAASHLPGGGALTAKAAAGKRPNILFLFTDDQRAGTVNAVNNPDVKTPTMDRIVRNGTTFTHAFIQGSTSGAVCICSRAMLIAGRDLLRATLTPKADEPVAFWPETFRKAGYDTFGTGKWHNGPAAFARCFSHGGKIFFGGMSDHLKVPVHDFDPTGQYPANKKYTGEKFSSELFSDAAIEFLAGRKGSDKPFFCYVSYTAPHDPRMAPKDYEAMYPPEKVPVPPNFLPEHPFDNGELKVRDENLAPHPRTPEIVQKHMAAYYAMITHVDFHMGRVLQALEDSGHADDTIVIFSADNGLAVGQHGLFGKQNLYEHSIRVPLVLAGPGIEKGKTIDALCHIHDLFPTTCEMAGLPIPRTVESLSLVPLLTGSKTQTREALFAMYKGYQRAIRQEQYKLIRYPRVKVTQLFDVKNDPWEMKNLADLPEHKARVQDLNAKLKQLQKKYGDDLDMDNPRPGQGDSDGGKSGSGRKKGR